MKACLESNCVKTLNFDTITVGDLRFRTPLMIAIENHNFEIVSMLCDYRRRFGNSWQLRDEIEHAAYFFMKNSNDDNSDTKKSFELVKHLFQTLLIHHKIGNYKQFIDYNLDPRNVEKIDLYLMETLMNDTNAYVSAFEQGQQYNEQLKQWIDKLLMMFKSGNYYDIVNFILRGQDQSESKLKSTFMCPCCCNVVSGNRITMCAFQGNAKCMVCNQQKQKNGEIIYYQCEQDKGQVICQDCCIPLNICCLLEPQCLESHLLVPFVTQYIDNAQLLTKVFDTNIIGKYYDPSKILFYFCKDVKYLPLALIEKFIEIAPTKFVCLVRNDQPSVE